MALLQLVLYLVIGLLGPILLFRLLMQKWVGRDDGTLDRIEDYGRGWGEANWERQNQRQPGEAEKRKSQHDFEGARVRSAPTPMYMTETSRLAIDESADTSEPVPLSDLLPDDKQQNQKQ